jgi:hypothetical protein
MKDNHSKTVSLCLRLSVDTDGEKIPIELVCTNQLSAPIRVPTEFTTPDPYKLTLKDGDGQTLRNFSASHTFSFIANVASTKPLAPGESATICQDLMAIFTDIPKGNYTLHAELCMDEYLNALRKKDQHAQYTQNYTVVPSNTVQFFIPWHLHSRRFDELQRLAEEQTANYRFKWWNPYTWQRARH